MIQASTAESPGWVDTIRGLVSWGIDHKGVTLTLVAIIAVFYGWNELRKQQMAKGRALRPLGTIIRGIIRFAVKDDNTPLISKPEKVAAKVPWLTGKRLYLIGLPSSIAAAKVGVPYASIVALFILMVLISRAQKFNRQRHAIIMQMFNVANGECRYPRGAEMNPWAYINVQSWQGPATPGTTVVTYPASYQSEESRTREKFERQFNGTVSDQNSWTYQWESSKNRVICQPSSFLPTMAPYPGPGPDWDKIPIGISAEGGYAAWDVKTFPHALVCGPTGTGKSVLQRNILFHCMAHQDRWTICGIDPKRVELQWIKKYEKSVARVATELEDALDVLRMLKLEMHRRYQEMEAEGVNIYENLRDRPKSILLMVDETTILLAPEKIRSEEGKLRDEMHAEAGMILGELGRLARAAGIHVIACMQRPDAEFLKGETKANFDCRIVAGRTDTTPSMMILDSEAATRLPLIKGRGMIRLGGQMQTFQGFYAEGDWFDDWLAANDQDGSDTALPSGEPGGPVQERPRREKRERRTSDREPGKVGRLMARVKERAATPPAGLDVSGTSDPRDEQVPPADPHMSDWDPSDVMVGVSVSEDSPSPEDASGLPETHDPVDVGDGVDERPDASGIEDPEASDVEDLEEIESAGLPDEGETTHGVIPPGPVTAPDPVESAVPAQALPRRLPVRPPEPQVQAPPSATAPSAPEAAAASSTAPTEAPASTSTKVPSAGEESRTVVDPFAVASPLPSGHQGVGTGKTSSASTSVDSPDDGVPKMKSGLIVDWDDPNV